MNIKVEPTVTLALQDLIAICKLARGAERVYTATQQIKAGEETEHWKSERTAAMQLLDELLEPGKLSHEAVDLLSAMS